MLFSARIARPLCCLAIAAVAVMATGCASTPQLASAQDSSSAAPPTAASAQSPASASSLAQTADITGQAEQNGFSPEIRHGEVIFCKDETPVDSRIPKRLCLNKVGVQQFLLAQQHQREQMQRASSYAGQPPI